MLNYRCNPQYCTRYFETKMSNTQKMYILDLALDVESHLSTEFKSCGSSMSTDLFLDVKPVIT